MNSDCQLAHAALASRGSRARSEQSWPPVAKRIGLARERAGLSEADVAARAGLGATSEYWDLEQYDDEAFTCISISGLHSIARVLGTTAYYLLFGESPELPVMVRDASSVSALLREQLAHEGLSPSILSERIGWDVTAILADPKAVGDLNVQGLYDLCHFLNVDWVGAFLLAGESRPTAGSSRRTPE